MLKAHYDAVKARLEEHVALSGKVHDAVRVNDAGEFVRAAYVVLTAGMPETGGDRHARSQTHQDNAVFDFKLRAVGTSVNAVMGLLDAVSSQWLGWVPTVAGRRCFAMRYPRQEAAVLPELSVRPPLFYADVEYTLRSHFLTRSGS